MKTEIAEIRDHLVDLLKIHQANFTITSDQIEKFEVTGTIKTMQGKKQVDGIYFATVIPKPKDVRLYFFPIYTHVDQFKNLPENLRKCLKGKSCFHIKKMDDALEVAIKELIDKGVQIYQEVGWLTTL
ncbi:DUF1801 domain-containing protein [Aureispira anguillae]|nr:DUF1801 domain-containing protein [Aureispira anguillae]